MTLAGLAFRPDAFAAGVDIYGVSNWPRLLANTPSWWEDLRRLLFTEVGDPDQDAEYLRKISPVFHAANIRKPLRSEEHAYELQSLMRISYAVFCMKKTKTDN